MENDATLETTEISFGKEIAKSFAISTAVTAGSWAGMIAVGLAVSKIQDLKKKRAAKKAADEEK